MADAHPRSAVRDDRITVAAIGILAACVTTLAHEAVGHGGVCLLSGGHVVRLTNVYFRCDLRSVWISPAGPFGNYLAALLAGLLGAVVPRRATGLRLLLALVMAFSLFWEAGYLIFAGVKREGDYAEALRDAGAPTVWPWLAIAAGLTVYAVATRLVAAAAARFGPLEGGSTPRRAAGLFIPAYVAGASAMVVAAALYAPGRLAAMHLAALELGGAAFPLLLIGTLTLRARDGGAAAPAPPLGRDWAWIGAGLLAFAALAATLGRGFPA